MADNDMLFEKLMLDYTTNQIKENKQNFMVNPDLFDELGVKRGLRDKNGKGVLAGITNVSMIKSREKREDGSEAPVDGQLYYRGYNVYDLAKDVTMDGDFEFERISYLLAPSKDLMNSLTKSVLTLASYDSNSNDLSLENVLRQSLMLISVFPMMAVYGYHAYNYYECNESLYIHRPEDNLSYAQNLLRMLRPDKQYSNLEAKVLDLALMLHMEHGGGNNSTFTTRVVTSSGSDTYSVIAAALSSLKGPKHGGANIKVVGMMGDLKKNVEDWENDAEIKAYLKKILNKEAFDQRGLIYGMGHAVYSISDPRCEILRGYAEKLAKEKHKENEFVLYEKVEKLAKEAIAEERKIYKGVSANVDFYSGFVYSMLGIPSELYTPLFAMARIVGWSAHRMEELANADKIIRPAYVSIMEIKDKI